ncbi:MAG: hypothetical protein ACRDD7_12750 [Peptostreptococcaceae bacterium]
MKWIKNPKNNILLLVGITVLVGFYLVKTMCNILMYAVLTGDKFTSNELLVIMSTLTSGFGSFAGGVVGVMGAFFMYQYQKNKEEDSKKEIACKTLYEMINNSVQRTQELTEDIVDRYDKLIKQSNIDKLTGDISKDFEFIYSNNFKVLIDGLTYEECKSIDRFKTDIEVITQRENLSYLIYNEKWYNHLEKFHEVFVADISEWVNILLSKKYKYNAYKFLVYRDLMITNIEQMSRENLIKVQRASMRVSKRVHGYESIYKRI